MINGMSTARAQQRYDHRLRELVRRTRDLTIATDVGVPRSTARGWLRTAPTVVVSLDVADLTELELRHEILRLQQSVQKLAALLRLARCSKTSSIGALAFTTSETSQDLSDPDRASPYARLLMNN